VSVVYLGLPEYVAVAAEITGLDVDTLLRVARLELADSALHAPGAGFGETEFYPDFIDEAAVLVVRLAKNHPLPDGNKRVSWVALRLFVEINGWSWNPAPSVDDAERAVLASATSPPRGESFCARWAAERLASRGPARADQRATSPKSVRVCA